MKNQLSIFNFQSHEVRTIVIDDDVWFVCTDVANALGYATAKDASRHLDADEKGRHIVPTLGGNQELTIISESGLYALVLRSRKPEARKFAKWVTSEVLPTIRKTGGYGSISQEQVQQAMSMAMEVAAQAARTTFDAVLSGNDWKHQRFLFGLAYGNRNQPSVPFAHPIEEKAVVASLSRLAEMLAEPNGMMPSNVELATLANACNQRLAQRLRA